MAQLSDPVVDVDQLPLDEWNGFDEDNSTLENGIKDPDPEELKRFRNLELSIADTEQYEGSQGATSPARVVPLRRNVKYGTVGWDAYAIKRSLSRAGFGAWGKWGKVEKLFGRNAVKHLKAFQRKHGLKADGVYGPNTHKKLTRYFDSYGAYLMKKTIIPKPTSKRQAVVNAAVFGYHNRGSIHYTMSSLRMYGVRNHIKPPHIPRYEDCSSFATWCYYVAGASDPNGFGYAGWGYTGTLISHGTRISITQARPGDLIFYGRYWIPSHVAIYIGNGRVISHGSEVGPLLLPWNYRGDIHSIRSYL